MERLKKIVEDERKKLKETIHEMVEDYISKASSVLKKDLEGRALISNFIKMMAIEIVDMNFSEGTVKVGDVWYIYNDEKFPENKFVKLEDIEYDSNMDVLQGYEVCDVNLFIEELKKLGFEYFAYSKSFEKLYPFIEV